MVWQEPPGGQSVGVVQLAGVLMPVADPGGRNLTGKYLVCVSWWYPSSEAQRRARNWCVLRPAGGGRTLGGYGGLGIARVEGAAGSAQADVRSFSRPGPSVLVTRCVTS
jgi:hypothetical protein